MEPLELKSEQETQQLLQSASNLHTAKCSLLCEDEETAKFVCHLCMKSFYNATALQNHKKMQHDTNGFSGVNEKNTFLRQYEQVYNDLSAFKFIPLKSSEESDNVTTQDGLMTRFFTEDTTYFLVKVERDNMDDCTKRSRLDSLLKKTLNKPGKPSVDLRGPFTCTFPSAMRPDLRCRQIFFNCCDYSLHYREEHTKRRKAALRCQVCEKRLDMKVCSDTSPAQMQTVNQIAYTCRLCGQNFLNAHEFDVHNRVVHAKQKPYQCSICTKRFTQQGGLNQHMRMHTGIRPFQCTFCPKAFTQKAGLDQHLRTHTKIKPFKCVICSKCFSQSVHLRQHMRTHTNIQPFECTVCGRRFKQSSHLNFHMRSHACDPDLMLVDQHPQDIQYRKRMDYLNLANLQPVQDGETIYYAAELTPEPPQHSFAYQLHAISNHNN